MANTEHRHVKCKIWACAHTLASNIGLWQATQIFKQTIQQTMTMKTESRMGFKLHICAQTLQGARLFGGLRQN